MTDMPICPEGYNGDSVVLFHLAVEGSQHPLYPGYYVAMCAPVYFCPSKQAEAKRIMQCPGCFQKLWRNA